jgi:Domain of unknown function (DUF1707)/Domain of unknown function (DUF4190)
VVVQMNETDIPPLADKSQRTTDPERGLRTAMLRAVQTGERTGTLAAAGERRKMRASDADRDHVVQLLNLAYSEGQLSKDEYDARLDSAMSARTFADLDPLVTDLPAAQPSLVLPRTGTTVATPVAKVNPLAIASLACGLAQFVFGPLATIPAIVLGHVARSQIKRTGEQGAGLALAGLILGWVVVSLVLVVIVVGLAIAAGTHGTM